MLFLSQTPKLAAPSWTAVEVSPEKVQVFALVAAGRCAQPVDAGGDEAHS
jgi:hypothetical protein